MSANPAPIQRLVSELGKLPGIGQRTAQRLAFHILRQTTEDANALADAIREVKERIGLCEVCFNLADGPRCRICLDERRDPTVICVVEEPGDVIPIERTHEFPGRYHVLGGALSPIDGVDPVPADPVPVGITAQVKLLPLKESLTPLPLAEPALVSSLNV